MNHTPKHLFDLNPGDTGKITKYSSSSDESSRLCDLGLVEGTLFRVVRYAPLGDPVEIKFRGFHLSISKSAAETIFVQSL